MIAHEFEKRVRYGETDQMGYLYYGNYAQYYEIGRVEMLRSLGITYKVLESEHRVMMPVVSLQTRYIRPAYYDELLTIRTMIYEIPQGKSITFQVEILNEKKEIINGGTVKLCFVDMDTGQTILTPPFLLDKIKEAFDNEIEIKKKVE